MSCFSVFPALKMRTNKKNFQHHPNFADFCMLTLWVRIRGNGVRSETTNIYFWREIENKCRGWKREEGRRKSQKSGKDGGEEKRKYHTFTQWLLNTISKLQYTHSTKVHTAFFCDWCFWVVLNQKMFSQLPTFENWVHCSQSHFNSCCCCCCVCLNLFIDTVAVIFTIPFPFIIKKWRIPGCDVFFSFIQTVVELCAL